MLVSAQNQSRVAFVLWLVVCTGGAWAGPAWPAESVTVNGAALRLEPGAPPTAGLSEILSEAAEHRIVRMTADEGADPGLMHRARQRLVRLLYERAGYDVLVLPVGIYEGSWVRERLAAGAAAAEAAEPLYRVWRESPEFLRLLESVRDETGVEIIGGLSRYHATGKELYGEHLVALLERLGALSGTDPGGLDADRIRNAIGGRDRLSQATAEARTEAEAVVGRALEILAAPSLHGRVGAARAELELQFLRNWLAFIELERIRAGEIEAGDFAEREIRDNLRWFLQKRYRGRRLIWWEGRGGAERPLPVRESVLRLHLEGSSGEEER